MKNHSFMGAVLRRPLALAAMLFVIAASGNALLVGCGGKSSNTQSTSGTSSTENATPPADTASGSQASADTSASAGGGDHAALVAEGKQIYQEKCVLCHGPEGKGNGPAAAGLNPPPQNHTDAAYMESRTDAQLRESIYNGKGQMPAWGKSGVLNDHQITAVLAFVRTLDKPLPKSMQK